MTSAPVVRPFPWTSLDATTRADTSALLALREWGAAHARLGAFQEVLRGVLSGARVEMILRAARSEDASSLRGQEGGVAVAFGGLEATSLREGVILEAEGPLAAVIAARVLRRPQVTVTSPQARATPNLAGAFAAIASACLRRVDVGRPLRVLTAGDAEALLAEVARVGGEVWTAAVTLLVDDEAFVGRVILPRKMAPSVRARAWTRAGLRAMQSAELEISVVAAASLATAAEVASLQRGDAWMPGDSFRLRLTDEDGARRLVGPVVLAAPGSDVGACADLGEGGALVVGRHSVDLGGKETNMTESEADALVRAVGEVPVVVRVEIGSVEMRARDWAALGPGDVLSLGRRVAEPVTLRVGGAVLARGELVEIEGEVGVRILDRVDDDRTTEIGT